MPKMTIGMLWFDNNPETPLEAKIRSAIDYYLKKYHQRADLCYVHPTMIADGPKKKREIIAGVEVRPRRSTLPNHLWIGVNPD